MTKNNSAFSAVEATIKEMVKERYGSVLQFTNTVGIPYATFDSMIRRGVKNSTVDNVIKVCNALQISTDELSKGNIVPVINNRSKEPADVLAILSNAKTKLLNYEGLTFNGDPADPDSIQSILDAMEIGINIALKRKEANRIDKENGRTNNK